MRVQLTRVSSNKKTGPIPVSLTTEDTCPDICPLKHKGCYASLGHILIHWKRAEKTGMSWSEFCQEILSLPVGQLWRHNQAGDLPGKNSDIDVKKLTLLVKANLGKKGFTYTHKPINKKNGEAIKYANDNGFTINLSANNLRHADELAKKNVGPVVSLLPADQKTNCLTPEGRRVIVCPAVTKVNTNCMTCKLCANSKRSVIIGFPAHGVAKKKVNEIAKNELTH